MNTESTVYENLPLLRYVVFPSLPIANIECYQDLIEAVSHRFPGKQRLRNSVLYLVRIKDILSPLTLGA